MSDIHAEITSANQRFIKYFMEKDAESLGEHYTPGGQLMPTGSEIISGHVGIAQFWTGAFEMGLASVELDTLEVEQHGTTAIEVGTYTLKLPDGATADQGTYLVVWKKVEGVWKMHRDIWNTNLAA